MYLTNSLFEILFISDQKCFLVKIYVLTVLPNIQMCFQFCLIFIYVFFKMIIALFVACLVSHQFCTSLSVFIYLDQNLYKSWLSISNKSSFMQKSLNIVLLCHFYCTYLVSYIPFRDLVFCKMFKK